MEQSMPQNGIRNAISVAILVAASACSGPVINEAYMAKDSGGQEKADTFYEDGDEIHAIAFVNGGNPDTTIRFSLEGPMVSELELYPWPNRKSLGEKTVDGQVFRPDPSTGERYTSGPWPLGPYRMHIDLGGQDFVELDFTVVPRDYL